MDNLLLSMQSRINTMIFLTLLTLIICAAEGWSLKKSITKLNTSKKRKKNGLRADVKKKRSGVIAWVAVMAVFFVISGLTLRDYALDRESAPLSVTGEVIHAGYHRQSRKRRYRIIVDDGSEKGLSLYIHDSLIEEYGIEVGETYSLTYFPRTQLLCEVE